MRQRPGCLAQPSSRSDKTADSALELALVDLQDGVEHLQGIGARPLEGVAADDRAGGAAIAQSADLVVKTIEILGLAAREHDQALAVEARLHDVLDARRQGRAV